MGKITSYDSDTNPSSDDYVLVVDNNSGENKKVSLGDITDTVSAASANARTVKKTVAPNGTEADYNTDGTADQVQIQAAIDSITVGEIRLRSGTYYISDDIVLKSGITISGEGWGSTILKATSSLGNNPVITARGTLGTMMTDVTLTDFEIDCTDNQGTYNTSKKCVILNYHKRLTVDHVYMHNSNATGFGADFIVDSIITNNNVSNCGSTGHSISGGSNGYGIGIGAYASEPSIISNNVAYNNANCAYVLEAISGTATEQSEHFIFSNNIAIGNNYGVYSGGSAYGIISNNLITDCDTTGIYMATDSGFRTEEYIISNNHISNCAVDGIRLASQFNLPLTISDNHIYNNGEFGVIVKSGFMTLSGNHIYNNGKSGFHLSDSTVAHERITIVGNHIYNNGQLNVSTQDDGVRLEGTASGATNILVANNQIFDNQASPTQNYGIVLAATIDNVTISGNHFGGHQTGDISGASLATSIFNNRYYTGGDVLPNNTTFGGTVKVNGTLGVGIAAVSKGHIYQDTTDTGTAAGLTVEQDGTGDAVLQLLLSSATRWVMGVDNSDSDRLKWAANADVGTSTLMTLTTSGLLGIGVIPTSSNGYLQLPASTSLATGGIAWGTDTNLYRSAADTLKTDDSLIARMQPRVISMADATSFTPTGNTADQNIQVNTQAAGTLTANAPSGTPTDGQKLILRIKSTNAQTFSWNAIYRGSTTAPLPTTTTGGGKTDYYGFVYNAADATWDYVAAPAGF